MSLKSDQLELGFSINNLHKIKYNQEWQQLQINDHAMALTEK